MRRSTGRLATRRIEANDQHVQLASLAGLMMEFMQFAHARAVISDKLESLNELLERERTRQAGTRSAAA